MAKKQFFGIKYPFQSEKEESHFIDLNETYEDKVKSEILHVIFTPKGQRYRMPDFGTDIIKYLFEPNDSETWGRVKDDIKSQIAKYVPAVEFSDIQIYTDEESGHHLFANISYTITKGNYRMEDNIEVKIQ